MLHLNILFQKFGRIRITCPNKWLSYFQKSFEVLACWPNIFSRGNSWSPLVELLSSRWTCFLVHFLTKTDHWSNEAFSQYCFLMPVSRRLFAMQMIFIPNLFGVKREFFASLALSTLALIFIVVYCVLRWCVSVGAFVDSAIYGNDFLVILGLRAYDILFVSYSRHFAQSIRWVVWKQDFVGSRILNPAQSDKLFMITKLKENIGLSLSQCDFKEYLFQFTKTFQFPLWVLMF